MTRASNPAGDLEGLVRKLHDAWCPWHLYCPVRCGRNEGCPFYREVGQALLDARGIGRAEQGLTPVDLAGAGELERRGIVAFILEEARATVDSETRFKLVQLADDIRGDLHWCPRDDDDEEDP
jgi:hypothetical protein